MEAGVLPSRDNPRQLATAKDGTPLFVIYISTNKEGKYEEQDELVAEVEKVEGAEREKLLLQPARIARAAPLPIRTGRQPICPAPQKTGVVELAVFQEGMTLQNVQCFEKILHQSIEAYICPVCLIVVDPLYCLMVMVKGLKG